MTRITVGWLLIKFAEECSEEFIMGLVCRYITMSMVSYN